jgi:hypothetical protein
MISRRLGAFTMHISMVLLLYVDAFEFASDRRGADGVDARA